MREGVEREGIEDRQRLSSDSLSWNRPDSMLPKSSSM